jgi:hypothetical protein
LCLSINALCINLILSIELVAAGAAGAAGAVAGAVPDDPVGAGAAVVACSFNILALL